MYYLHKDARPILERVLVRFSSGLIKLATAESCSGGLIAAALTELPGSSKFYLGGTVAYANDVKTEVLKVSENLLIREGAVSEAVAEAMAKGIAALTKADIGIAVTGIAGPGGGSPQKPVGTVWFGFSGKAETFSECVHLTGDRSEIRAQIVEIALTRLLSYVDRLTL